MLESNCQPIDRPLEAIVVRDFFDDSDRYLANNGNIQIRQMVVRELVGNIQNAKILDLGCGDGSIALQFVDGSNAITLVDISSKMLEAARMHTPATFQMTVEYINEEIAAYQSPLKYDLILCLGVLAHVDSVEAVVRKIGELLKVDGKCILQITDRDRVLGKFSVAYCDIRNRISGRYPKALNQTRLRELHTLASRFNMKCVVERRYATLLPGMGKLPVRWRSGLQLFSLRTSWLSKYCSETILLFSKTA
jgi:ubiquinone/menaquinone biosynthesis C-methylase UbiE